MAIATNDRLESLLKKGAVQRGVRVVRHTRALGVDYSARARGRKRTAVQAARVKGARARGCKLLWAKRSGAATHKVGKAGLTPAMVYGMKCLAAPWHARQRARKLVNMVVVGKTHSRSLTMRLAIAKADPLHGMRAALCLRGRGRFGITASRWTCAWGGSGRRGWPRGRRHAGPRRASA